MFHCPIEVPLGLFPHRHHIRTIDPDIDRNRPTGKFRMGSECCHSLLLHFVHRSGSRTWSLVDVEALMLYFDFSVLVLD